MLSSKCLTQLQLADALLNQNKTEEGLSYYRKTLDHYTIVLGRFHSRTAAVRLRMVDQYIKSGDLVDARQVYYEHRRAIYLIATVHY